MSRSAAAPESRLAVICSSFEHRSPPDARSPRNDGPGTSHGVHLGHRLTYYGATLSKSGRRGRREEERLNYRPDLMRRENFNCPLHAAHE